MQPRQKRSRLDSDATCQFRIPRSSRSYHASKKKKKKAVPSGQLQVAIRTAHRQTAIARNASPLRPGSLQMSDRSGYESVQDVVQPHTTHTKPLCWYTFSTYELQSRLRP